MTARNAALKFLRNEGNLEQQFHRHYPLREKVWEIFGILTQIQEVMRSRHSGASPHDKLRGFNFWDVAINPDPFSGVYTTLKKDGTAWISLVQEQRALVLFGNGFGELIQPLRPDQMDSPWQSVPHGKDYLGFQVADVEPLLERTDGLEGEWRWLTENLLLYDPSMGNEAFQCPGKNCNDLCRVVHVLLPRSFYEAHEHDLHMAPELNMNGAVILGYNSKYHGGWNDTGKSRTKAPESGIHTSVPQTSERQSGEVEVDRSEWLDPASYSVVWIAPLPIEVRAALVMMEKVHNGRFRLSDGRVQQYYGGEMCNRNVIVATFPFGGAYGTESAAMLAADVKVDFPQRAFVLLVGVAAGLPVLCEEPKLDIRLGDVLVAHPCRKTGHSVIAYELGKETETGFELERGANILIPTPENIQHAIGKIFHEAANGGEPRFLEHYRKIASHRHEEGTFEDPGPGRDALYERNGTQKPMPVNRPKRSQRTQVWHGPIASGNKLLKSSIKRDQLRDKYRVIGVEMEAAGAMRVLEVGVIRGVCDYGDSYKNKEWQPYAAAIAAAYAKQLVSYF